MSIRMVLRRVAILVVGVIGKIGQMEECFLGR